MTARQINTLAATPMARMGRQALGLALGVGLLTLSAKTSVPFWPVPMTLQTLVVLLFAAVLGPQRAIAVLSGYVALGLAGAPVFAGAPDKGLGLAYLMGPTGGYILGFFAASVLVGVAYRAQSALVRCGGIVLGTVAIYLIGGAWLAQFIPLETVWAAGVLPFLAGDAVKGLLVLLIAGRLRGSLKIAK